MSQKQGEEPINHIFMSVIAKQVKNFNLTVSKLTLVYSDPSLQLFPDYTCDSTGMKWVTLQNI